MNFTTDYDFGFLLVMVSLATLKWILFLQ